MKVRFKQQAFTLIEVIIAISILSLLLLMLYSSLFTTSKSLSLGNKHIESAEKYRLALNFLRRTIEQTQPLMQLSEQGSELIFSGKNNTLGFTATLPSHRGGGGLYYVELNNYENDVYLTYINMQNKIVEFDKSETKKILLLKEQNFRFSYYGKNSNDQFESWNNNWTNTKILPSLIKLEFVFKSKGVEFKNIIIPLRVNFSAGKPQFTLLTQ